MYHNKYKDIMDYEAEVGRSLVFWLSWALILINAAAFTSYLFLHYTKNVEMETERYKHQWPNSKCNTPYATLYLYVWRPLFHSDASSNFIITILISILGLSISNFFNSLQIMLIVPMATSTKNIFKAMFLRTET